MRVSPSGRWHVTFNHERFILLGGSNPLTRTIWGYSGMANAPDEICGKRQQRLRLIPTKNGQTKGITFAKDYHLKDVIERL